MCLKLKMFFIFVTFSTNMNIFFIIIFLRILVQNYKFSP